MHKKTTLQSFTVFLLRTVAPLFVLMFAFQLASAQNLSPELINAKKKSYVAPTTNVVDERGLTKEQVKALRSTQAPQAGITSGTPTDVPELNRQIAAKRLLDPSSNSFTNPVSTNIVGEVCTFNGGLVAGDATLTNGRFFRDGIPSTCAAPKACGGPFGTGPYFYDTYTLQNLSCATQCVTVNYIANAGGGDVFVVAYNGSFNPANLCTNYMADGGSSSLSGGAAVTFSVTVPANTTVVFVVMAAQPNTPCPSYTMTVDGLNCSTPPVCTAPTSSVLSQFQIPGPNVTLFNEGFNTVVPAGWVQQNNSQPVGLTNWFQGNAGVFPANSGPTNSYAAANFNNTTGTNIISNWLFPPSVLLKNGDQFSFYTRSVSGAFPDRMQVRLNTTNTGTNVGATNTSVGDYSTLLLDINPTYTATGYPTAWTQYTLTMSGLPAAGVNGRLAFRYFVENAGPGGANSNYIGIDDAVYTTTTMIDPTTCTGSTAGLKVNINGGSSATYNVTINATPGGPFTVNNYMSGDYIPVMPTGPSTSYTLVSVIDATNPCCVGTGNSGNPTITVSPLPVGSISITEDPTGPLCAGNPKLLTVIGSAGTQTFSNPAPITINTSGPGSPYPSNIVVSGLPIATTVVKSVTIRNISHTWSTDVDILLQSPTGVNVTLISDVGSGSGDFTNNTYILDDAAAGTIPNVNNPPNGTYRPTNVSATDNFPAPGPGSITQATPTLSSFVGDPNGTWRLFVVDDLGGDGGQIAGGYDITFNFPPSPLPAGTTIMWTPTAGLSNPTSNPVAASPMTTRQYTAIATVPGGCQTSASILITVNQLPAVTSNPANATACAGANATFTVTATGAGITYQWQESTNGGTTYANITNGGIYSGATTPTLTLTGVTNAMNNYRYRCVISGTCPPAANSTGAILTVNALPVVTISPVGQQCGGVPGTNGLALTASGASTYTWAPIAGLYTNATATTAYTGGNAATVYAAPTANTVYTVTGTASGTGCSNTASISVVYTPPAPSVSPASVTKCLPDAPVQLCITSSLAPAPFTTMFSSGNVNIPTVSQAPAGINSVINASALPATANITAVRVNMNLTHTWAGDMAVVLKAPNGQVLNLSYYLSGTGAGPTTGMLNTTITSNDAAGTLGAGANPWSGTYRADKAIAGNPAPGPTAFMPTTANWSALYPAPSGNWTLAMWDAFAGDDGVLQNWSITFDYLYGPPAPGVWSPAAGLFMDAAGTIPYVAGTSVNCVYANPTPSGTYPYMVTVTSVGPNANQSFANPAPITINASGAATPYPSNLVVSGLPATGSFVESVTLTGMNHTWAADVDVLLQSPSGQNVVLMSDVGGNVPIPANANYTFMDGATAMATSPNPSGTYAPTNAGATDNWPAPGPGSITQAAPALSMFTGDMNGTWKLFIFDDIGGDAGNVSGGYSINFAYPTVGCTSPARTVNVKVNDPAVITVQPVDATVCTDKVATFSVTVTGTPTIGYQWQVSTNSGNTYSNVSNGGVYSGATTNTLTITAPPVSMNNYMYRCVVQGAAPCPAVTSFQRTLRVNPLPTIVIASSAKLFPGLTTTLTSTVSPAAAASYTWFRDGAIVAGASSGSLLVDIDGLGDYQLMVTDVNNCTNRSNIVTISDSATSKCFLYPNPTSGVFQVRYHSVKNNVLPRMLTIYDMMGERVYTRPYTIGRPYDRMDVDMRAFSKGTYTVEIGDLNGSRLAVCRVVIQ